VNSQGKSSCRVIGSNPSPFRNYNFSKSYGLAIEVDVEGIVLVLMDGYRFLAECSERAWIDFVAFIVKRYRVVGIDLTVVFHAENFPEIFAGL
jgi:hypothetical protein